MKIARFLYKKEIFWGRLKDNFVAPLLKGPFGKIELASREIPCARIKFLPPAVPSKIILVGLNYRDHAQELKMKAPRQPLIFIKPNTALIGHQQGIAYPKGVRRLDYEAELAIVIGAKGKFIPEQKAHKYILGYTCLNDVTARDLQRRDSQWTRAKSFDTFCPLGPCLETKLNPQDLKIRLYLNGRLKQDSSTANFIFSVEYLVSFISRIMTLLPGDIISTGTPPGVGSMKKKDTVEVEIEGIGRLANCVI